MGPNSGPLVFPRYWAIAALGLIGVTWPLWWPSTNGVELPSISLLAAIDGVLSPSGLIVALRVATVLTLVALVAAIVWTRRVRWAWGVVALSLSVSFLLDQHRLQPWAYQTCIYSIVFACADRRWIKRLIVLMAGGVYFYSAVGKFDFQFMHTVGQDFLQPFVRPLSALTGEWTAEQRAPLTLLFPTMELLAAIGWFIPITRSWAALLLISMHVTLIGILGPWSLDHSLGVLAWNVALMGQAYLLGWRDRPKRCSDSTMPLPSSKEQEKTAGALVGQWIAIAVVGFAMLAPLGERAGYWDHWLSWSLYSPHTSRAEIQLHQSAVGKLPTPVQAFVETGSDGSSWRRLSIEAWSLETRRVPVYPQARYQVSLAREIARRYNLNDSIRLIRKSASDRWSGERTETRLIGQRELEEDG